MKIESGSAYRQLLSLFAAALILTCGGAVNAVTPMISMGYSHSLALDSAGAVFAWGSDEFGKLGIGRSVYSATPNVVVGLNSVLAIGVGQSTSFAIRHDGTLWAWGENRNGQIGDGTNTDRTSPVQVPGISNALMVCGGQGHTLLAKQDGTVWSWGDNTYGELGNGNNDAASRTAVNVKGMSAVIAVACGASFSMALRQDGTVWSWGDNSGGQLGDGTTVARFIPMQIPGLSDVTAIGAGNETSYALKQDGTIWTWGADRSGNHGSPALLIADRTTIFPPTPVSVLGITNIVAVAGSISGSFGTRHSLALDSGGTVWSWGSGGNGQLGNGGIANTSIPVVVMGLPKIVQVSAGYRHSLAVDEGGDVWTWGDNTENRLATTPAHLPVHFRFVLRRSAT